MSKIKAMSLAKKWSNIGNFKAIKGSNNKWRVVSGKK